MSSEPAHPPSQPATSQPVPSQPAHSSRIDLRQTPLHGLHVELGARMVPFAGYDMPVQYPAGILQEHRHTREKAGLFDVSHMGQVRLTGDRRAAALESLVPGDILGLKEGRMRYTLFTNPQGGILDDLMVSNLGDHLFLVVNASRKDDDLAHLEAGIGEQAGVELLDDRALLALQGPAASAVLAGFAPEAAAMKFMTAAVAAIKGVPVLLTRSGYTGEDGYEISVAAKDAEAVARRLLAEPEVAPVGLGARDSLRLEAGLCLYGHDIDQTTTVIAADLAWTIGKPRRPGGEREGGFPGADVILAQLAGGTDRKRVGLKPDGRQPAREGTAIVDADGRTIGIVTSGGFGPTVNGPVAMGYVDAGHAAPDTIVYLRVRGKELTARVAPMPFVEHHYHRG